jgi:hypothetical protein
MLGSVSIRPAGFGNTRSSSPLGQARRVAKAFGDRIGNLPDFNVVGSALTMLAGGDVSDEIRDKVVTITYLDINVATAFSTKTLPGSVLNFDAKEPGPAPGFFVLEGNS